MRPLSLSEHVRRVARGVAPLVDELSRAVRAVAGLIGCGAPAARVEVIAARLLAGPRIAPLVGAEHLDVGLPAGTIFSLDGTAAGYAIYGAATSLVVSFGDGTDGFTLDTATGDFVLTHPGLRVRAGDEVSSTGTLLLDVHRVLRRGGLACADEVDPVHAAPLVMLVEQAGGAAVSSGGRLLLGAPDARPYRSPLFGSRSLFSEG